MKKLLVLLALTLLAACSPKKSSVKANIGAPATINIAGVATGTSCVNTSQNSGYIYDNSASSYNFETQVKALLSATTNPSEVGSISAQATGTGVGVTGLIKMDASGNVVGAQSNLLITVHDSIWQTNPTEENKIKLNFTPANGSTLSGQFNVTSGDGFLSVADKYGEVRFEGKIDAQNFSGTVRFTNLTTVIGGTPASGALGQFQIQRCAIFK